MNRWPLPTTHIHHFVQLADFSYSLTLFYAVTPVPTLPTSPSWNVNNEIYTAAASCILNFLTILPHFHLNMQLQCKQLLSGLGGGPFIWDCIAPAPPRPSADGEQVWWERGERWKDPRWRKSVKKKDIVLEHAPFPSLSPSPPPSPFHLQGMDHPQMGRILKGDGGGGIATEDATDDKQTTQRNEEGRQVPRPKYFIPKGGGKYHWNICTRCRCRSGQQRCEQWTKSATDNNNHNYNPP